MRYDRGTHLIAGVMLVVLAAALAGLVFFWLIPMLGRLIGKVVLISLALSSLGLMAFFIFDPRMRRALWRGWVGWWERILARLGLTHPAGRVRNYLAGLEQDLADMDRHLHSLRKHRARLSALMAANKQKMQGHLDRAARHTHPARRALELRKAGRLRHTTERYRMLDRRLETVIRILERLSMHTRMLLEDMREEIALRQREAAAFSAAANAMNEGRNVPDAQALFEEIENGLKDKVTEVHALMDRLRAWLEGMEPEAGIFAEEGLEMLEAWERKHLKYQNPTHPPRLPDRSSLSSPFDSLFDDDSSSD